MTAESVLPVLPADFPRVVAVWEASVRATHYFVSEEDIEIFRPLVHAGLPTLPIYCVRNDHEQIVGFIGVSDHKIEMLFIDPAWRGHGIGKRLIEYAVESLGSTHVDVNEQNEQALGFYLHMGFEVESRDALDGMGKPYPILHMCLNRA